MTLAPRRPPLTFEDMDDAAAALRERGVRLSTVRRLVLESLFAAEGPVSAEWIADGMGDERLKLDVSSVYRNLERLEELGLVKHVHLGHGPGLYALEQERQLEYLVCEECGRVDSVEASQLDDVRAGVRERFGYEVQFNHFPIVGLCRRCAAAESRAAPPTLGPMTESEHTHDDAHVHEHEHDDGTVHSHPHTSHEHGHTEHEHEHTHEDGTTHTHPHVHEEGLEHSQDGAHFHDH